MVINETKIKRRLKYNDLDISIEVPANTYRSGKDNSGKEWKKKVSSSYGYIRNTNSPDGEHLDCWVSTNPDKNAKIYVIHQMVFDGSKYDEDKVMIGFKNKEKAISAYKKEMPNPEKQFGDISEFDIDHFKVIAYQARKSKCMLSNEEIYDNFKRKNLIPRGIKSPVSLSKIVKESTFGLFSLYNEVDLPHNKGKLKIEKIFNDRLNAIYETQEFSKRVLEDNTTGVLGTILVQMNDDISSSKFVDYDSIIKADVVKKYGCLDDDQDIKSLQISVDEPEGDWTILLSTDTLVNKGTSYNPLWVSKDHKFKVLDTNISSKSLAYDILDQYNSGERNIILDNTPVSREVVNSIKVIPTKEYQTIFCKDNKDHINELNLSRHIKPLFNTQTYQTAKSLFLKYNRSLPLNDAISQAAKDTGISPRDLQYHLKKIGLVEAYFINDNDKKILKTFFATVRHNKKSNIQRILKAVSIKLGIDELKLLTLLRETLQTDNLDLIQKDILFDPINTLKKIEGTIHKNR